jgi:hypothetical protein
MEVLIFAQKHKTRISPGFACYEMYALGYEPIRGMKI